VRLDDAEQEKMSDTTEIEETAIAMLFAVDRLDWPALRGCFADAVKIDYTKLFGGEPETIAAEVLLDRWRGLLPGFDATQHLTGPVIVSSMTGDRAVAETHVRAYHYIDKMDDGTWMIAGHYTLQMIRGETWVIAGIHLDVYKQEGNTNLPGIAVERVKLKLARRKS
jgi:hypothetical protein